jgi:hypothetical protein
MPMPSEAAGCWVVWLEDGDADLTSVHNSELDAYRTAYGSGPHLSTHVTFVPYGKSIYDVRSAPQDDTATHVPRRFAALLTDDPADTQAARP